MLNSLPDEEMGQHEVTCPTCQGTISVSNLDAVGRQSKCERCGTTVIVPAPLAEVLADQRRRYQAGEGINAESYFESNPSLAADPQAALDIICNEIILRQEAGETPNLAEYLRRFPHLEEELRVQFEVEFALQDGPLFDTTASPDENNSFGTTVDAVHADAGDTRPVLPDIPEQAGRYRIESEIARGGMGVVLRAHDSDFGRSLAVKIILPKALAQPQSHHRFLAEARITGQLQHPGIPPIHEMGNLEDGRPFFAMKLIEGQTLAQLLKVRVGCVERTDAQGAENDDGAFHSPYDLPRFLHIFEQICQTIAYAHSRGIIHRDLKPQNIMVGAFGEVQVMDWGLAKSIGSQGSGIRSQESGIRSQESGIRSQESGVGDQPKAHRRRSVGQPPIVAPITPSDDRLSQTGQLMGTPAYMAPEQARGEINELDKRCDVFGLGAILCEMLTGRPAYQGMTAMELVQQAVNADLTEAYQRLDVSGADTELIELAKQCLAPHKEDRLLNAGAVADAVAKHQTQVQDRLRQAELDKAQAQVQAAEERKRREIEQAKTREERRRRRATLALAVAVLFIVVGAGSAAVWYVNDRAQRKTAEARREAKQRADEARREGEKQARRKHLHGEMNAALDEADTHLGNLQRSLEELKTARGLLSDLKSWNFQVNSAQAAWRRADSLASGNEKILDPKMKQRLRSLQDRLNTATQDFKLAFELDQIRLEASTISNGKFDQTQAAPKYAVAFQKLDLNIGSGDIRAIAKRIRQSSVRYALVAALDHLAEVHFVYPNGDLQMVPRLLEIARLADPHPWRDRLRHTQALEDAKTLENLAADVNLSEHLPQTLILLAAVLKGHGVDSAPLLRSARVEFPQDFWLHFELGNRVQRPEEQAGYFRVAVAVRPQSVAVYFNLGNALQAKGDLAAAIAHFEKARDIAPDITHTHTNLGAALAAKGDLKGALASFKEAVRLDPRNAFAHYNLGSLLSINGDRSKAIGHYEKAVASDPKLAFAHYNLAVILLDDGDRPGAIRHFTKAVESRPNYAKAHAELALLLYAKGGVSAALDHLRKAVKADPKLEPAHANLGNILMLGGNLADAIGHYKVALKLNPKDAKNHYNLGNAMKADGDLLAAIRHYQGALKVDPSYAEAHCNLGHALRRQGDFQQALQSLRRGHELGSKQPGWRYPSEQWVKNCESLVALSKIERLKVIDDKTAGAGIQGNLTKESPLDIFHLTQKCFRQSHAVRLRANNSYQIDLTGDFDTFLRVEDNKYNPVLQNDDVSPPKLLHSRLVFTPAKDGTYRFVVTSYQAGTTGKYTLKLRRCASVGKPEVYKNSLTKADKSNNGRFFKLQKIKLTTGRPHTIILQSQQFDTDLYLLDPTGKKILARNDDIVPGNTNVSRIDFTPLATATYTIVVATIRPGETGEYTLRIESFNIAPLTPLPATPKPAAWRR